RAVHGHFHPNKYQSLDNVIRATFLREPVSRLLSHYYFWLNLPDTPEASGNPLHTYMLREKLSILEFARLPIIQDFTTGIFFKDVDMTTFDFIGRQECYLSDISKLGRLIGYRGNVNDFVNSNPVSDYQDDVKATVLAELRALLRDEIDFYHRWAGRGT